MNLSSSEIIATYVYKKGLLNGDYSYSTAVGLFNTIITVTGAIREYDEVFVTTNGGPGHASETLATYLYKVGFRNDQMGYASAIAFFIFIVTFIIGLMQMKGYEIDDR